MATILEKKVIRESKSQHDNRNIVVSLTEDQEVSLKLKGLKSGELTISINDLYNYLSGNEGSEEKEVEVKKTIKTKTPKNAPLINLNDLRSLNAITKMDLSTKVLFESLIVELIENTKKYK